ncbi:hypothetical protein RCL_jg10059.t2 [Rhizophagus clarus]|uniref:Uncharacterized protein n=1 Tax=Rhizophagus clarus TaxID=94130 RepID=A0A8H3QD08_9GLOM|nr:hypothetical protein RCL_jg10059.t2 [Rhizophagus clarus]
MNLRWLYFRSLEVQDFTVQDEILHIKWWILKKSFYKSIKQYSMIFLAFPVSLSCFGNQHRYLTLERVFSTSASLDLNAWILLHRSSHGGNENSILGQKLHLKVQMWAIFFNLDFKSFNILGIFALDN